MEKVLSEEIDQVSFLKELFYKHIEELQDQITTKIQFLDPSIKLTQDYWDWLDYEKRKGGGGRTRYFSGQIFESAGVNISKISGKMKPEFMQTLNPKAESIFATGISLILHPRSPKIPTVHANFRMLVAMDKNGNALKKEANSLPTYWFGGGADLTPYYPIEEDFYYFHQVWKDALKDYPGLYNKMKDECDNYFTNHHRKISNANPKLNTLRPEMRGIGGIFFDHFNSGDFVRDFQMLEHLSSQFIKSYFPIVEKRIQETWTEEDEAFQLHRRGRYVEFNLIHDRGTHFGLKSQGRTESILVSLPPRCTFTYQFPLKENSPQEKMMGYYLPFNWTQESNDSKAKDQ